MTIRDLRARARRLSPAAGDRREALDAADDAAFAAHALARLRHFLSDGPEPAPLPADVVRRLEVRAAARPPIDEAALLERLRRLIGAPDVRKGPLP